MRSGTATRSAEQISREIEFFGSQIGFDLAEDYFGFKLDIQKSYLASVISLLADVVLNPAFRSANVTEEKSLQMAEMRRSLDNSQERPHQLLLQVLYANHPYALPATGYAGSLGSLDPESLRAWWKGHVVGDEALICVVGDITAEEAGRFVQTNFGALPRRGTPRPAPPMVSYPASRTDIGEYRSRKQSAISLGFPTVPRSHEDWPALRVIANAASGWKGTLFAELRGRRSLAYTVFARQESTTEGGAFVAYMGTDAAKEKEAREALVVEIRKLAAEAISEKQLALAKSSLAGVTRIYFQTNAAHVAEMARNRFNSLPLDFSTKLDERTQSLTLAEVRRVAEKYLTHDRYVEAIVHGKTEGSPQSK
jgi:zinc protease